MAKREFKGIWIPKDIWLNKSLSISEMFILTEIDSYDNDFGCIATNKTLCEDLRIQPSTVSGLIKSLEEKGFIRVTYKDYNTFEGRTIIMLPTPFGNPKAPSEKSGGPSEKSIPSNIFSNTSSNLNINVDLKKSTSKSKEDSAHHRIIKHFFEVLHPSFVFGVIHAKTVKELILKTKTLLKKAPDRVVDEQSIGDFMIKVLDNLPEYYKEKDLAVINSKFNEIISEIKNNIDGKQPTVRPTAYTAARESADKYNTLRNSG